MSLFGKLRNAHTAPAQPAQTSQDPLLQSGCLAISFHGKHGVIYLTLLAVTLDHLLMPLQQVSMVHSCAIPGPRDELGAEYN